MTITKNIFILLFFTTSIIHAQDSTYTNLWGNGIKKEEGIFSNRKKEGDWNKWNQKGELLEVENYISGILTSRTSNIYFQHETNLLYQQKKYDGDNILMENRSYNFQDNNKYYVSIYKNGNKVSKGKIFNNEKIGKWNHYNEDGTLSGIKNSKKSTTKIIVKDVFYEPTKYNSIIKIYRTKRFPPSKTLKNGKSINSVNFDLYINNENFRTISNGSYFEYEIKNEGVFKIEGLITNSETIHLFVKLGRTYFLECDVTDEDPNGKASITLVDPLIGLEKANKIPKSLN
tara:strand:- start:184 stop:1044 length:861 start_codon:yes stop_codon:yes gene_type:complete